MITEQEAREAARRVCVAINDDSDGIIDVDTAEKLYGTRDMNLAVECGQRDVKAIVMWADQELARREAERAERAKPIDAEWLESIGFFGAGMNGWSMLLDCKCGSVIELFLNHDNEVSLAQDSDIVALTSLGDVKTRGQLLDLLAALKGGET